MVGGNYVGLELGQLFARLGSKITLIEALDRLVPGEEPELSETIAGVLADEGVEVWTSAALAEVRREGERGRMCPGYLHHSEPRRCRAHGRASKGGALGIEVVASTNVQTYVRIGPLQDRHG